MPLRLTDRMRQQFQKANFRVKVRTGSYGLRHGRMALVFA
jgi:hypothetical protein